MHSFTTYAGLLDLRFWARALVTLEGTRLPAESAEQFVTRQAREVLDVNRAKQVFAIDDFYYFEIAPYLAAEAAQRPRGAGWIWGETTGALFRTDGTASDRRFWALRFYLDQRSNERAFIRIPMGLHTLIEHLAVGVDFASEMSVGDEASRFKHLEDAITAAYTPELLHYYALTHRLSSALGRMYSPAERVNTFTVSTQVVAVLADIPFDDPFIWATLHQYAKDHSLNVAEHMAYPHPSFVFPLLVHAFEQLALPMNQLTDWASAEQTADQLLTQLGLPIMVELQAKRDLLASEVKTLLDKGASTGTRSELLSWLGNYEQGLTRAEKYLAPTSRLGGSFPVPVLFADNGYWEGSVLSMSECQVLVEREARYHELLRIPAFRDIVP
ncbi:hypothetical protein [Stigmatella aurantiaca]|uniref:hypothetical protein n=1 Tax=Stigmatella aurantiaca TaxID=41 RepID=UPI0005613144|nr:hypothetical protein [Stigmatella aurantiaca]